MRALLALAVLLSAPAAAAAPRLVVLDVATEEKGIKPSSLAAVSDLVTLEIDRYSRGGKDFDVLSGREIRDALKLEGERQSLGCDATSCASEIAQAFGARYVAFLVLTRLGSRFSLNLSLFDSTDSRIVGRGAAQADTVAALSASVPDAVRQLVKSIARVDDVKPAAPLPPPAAKGSPGAALSGVATTVSFPTLVDDEVALQVLPLTAEDASICDYDGAEDRWHCGGAKDPRSGRQRAVVEQVRQGSATTAGVARFVPRGTQGCLEAVDVELVSADESVTVDWRDAVFVVDGEAVPARPIRPLERAMTAPAGAVAKETIIGQTVRCLGGRALAPGKEHDAVALTLGFTVGGVPARAKFLRTRTRASVDEQELLQLVPAPELPLPPPDLVPEDADAPFGWGAVTGAAAGGVVGVAAGAFVGGLWMPKSAGIVERGIVGAGYGGACVACVGLPLAGVGLLFDWGGSSTFEEKRRKSDSWRAEKRRVAAYQRAVGRGLDLDEDGP